MPWRTVGMRPIAGGIAVVLAMATAAWAAQANPPLEIDEQARQVLDDFARNDRELKSFQVVIETQIASDFKGQQFKQSSVLRLSAERQRGLALRGRSRAPDLARDRAESHPGYRIRRNWLPARNGPRAERCCPRRIGIAESRLLAPSTATLRESRAVAACRGQRDQLNAVSTTSLPARVVIACHKDGSMPSTTASPAST